MRDVVCTCTRMILISNAFSFQMHYDVCVMILLRIQLTIKLHKLHYKYNLYAQLLGTAEEP